MLQNGAKRKASYLRFSGISIQYDAIDAEELEYFAANYFLAAILSCASARVFSCMADGSGVYSLSSME